MSTVIRTQIHLKSREKVLFREAFNALTNDTHRIFVWLLLGQWAATVALAALNTPSTWRGDQATIHPHLLSAIFLGGVINSVPLYLIRVAPFSPLTRHVVVMSQIMWSAMLIHISGGRIESHFHIFGSLAVIAFYRDWTLLLTATALTAGDHLLRGAFWPESVYGTQQPEWWRFLEHTGWVLFAAVILILTCIRGQQEMRASATRAANLENMCI